MDGWQEFDRVIAVLGLLANALMAGAAVWAFKTWRQQLRGESEHDLAKRLSGVLYRVSRARENTLRDLKLLESQSVLGKALVGRPSTCDSLMDQLEDLEVDVHTMWGDEVASVVATIRKCTRGALRYTVATADGNHRARIAYARTKGRYTGDAFAMYLAKLDAALRLWLAQHLGREDGVKMSVEALVQLFRDATDTATAAFDKEWEESSDEVAEDMQEAAEEYAADIAGEQAEKARFDNISLEPDVEVAEDVGARNGRRAKGRKRETE